MNGNVHAERFRRTASFVTATETHTFAAAVAANALLSFFPFLVLLLSLAQHVLHDPALARGLVNLVRAYLPVDDSSSDFIVSNLQATVDQHARVQVISLVILLLGCSGIFLPLEVALNRVFGAPRNRTYLGNWALSVGLAFVCGVLGMMSASLSALSETYSLRLARYLTRFALFHPEPLSRLVDLVSVVLIRAGALPFTIAAFYLIYRWLPNIRTRSRQVLPAAITAGVLWEVSKYIYILLLPWLNFREVYGPFAISVTLVLWALVSALIVLTCAEVAVVATDPLMQVEFAFPPTGPLGLDT